MIYFLIYHLYYISSRLIVSNTLQEINNAYLYDQNINLTIWIQLRFPIINLDSQQVNALKIIDSDNIDQVIIKIVIIDEYRQLLCFDLQNISKQHQLIHRDNLTLEWQKIKMTREVCFKNIQYSDINMSIICNNQFNATIFVFQSISIHLYVYDQEEFENEEIILQNVFLKDNKYMINTLKDDLVIKFYAKFICCQRQNGIFFFFTLLQKINWLFYQFNSNQIEIHLRDEDQQVFQSSIINLDYDQWVLFSIQFDVLDIIIYFNINNTNNVLTFQLEKYLTITDMQYLNFQFMTKFILSTSDTIIFQYLQIISFVSNKNQISCTQNCLFCLNRQCLDFEKTLLSFNISNEIKNSIYYNQNYLENYQYNCDDKNYFLKNGKCIEFPKYKDQYCFNCHIMQKSIYSLNLSYYLAISIPIISYNYYLENLYEISEKQIQQGNGLIYENDLNIFLMKDYDIYLIYKLSNHIYCEKGYSFNNKCYKIQKKCYVKIYTCIVCQQQYALIHNKCVKCQNNCLYCKIVNKKLICILFAKNYFKKSNGLVQQCMKNSLKFNCLDKNESMNQLNLKGHQICQHHQIFDIKISKCLDMQYYKEIFQFIQYFPLKNLYDEQELEIQDKMLESSEEKDQQIYGLISIQQVSKLSYLIRQTNKNQSLLSMNKNFHFLHLVNCSLEDISYKKIILHDIYVFLEDIPIIIFENIRYFSLIEIYNQLQIKFKIVQYDIIFSQHLIRKGLVYFFEIHYLEFKNTTFIINITFKINPSILYKNQIKFFFIANEILINNLVFNQINENIDEELVLTDAFINIDAEKIQINNLVIQNIRLKHLFYAQEYKSLDVQNIWIMNSNISELIYAFNVNKNNQMIQISNIHANQSILINFIAILNAKQIKLSRIIYESSKLTGYNFQFNGEIDFITINNLFLIKLNLVRSLFIKVKLQNNIQKTSCSISNIYAHTSKIMNSSLFQTLQVKSILLSSICLKIQIFKDSNLIHLQNFLEIQIQRIQIDELMMEGQYPLIYIIGNDQNILKNFYLKNLYCSKQPFFYVKTNKTVVQNFNFHQINLAFADFILIESQYLDLKRFIFYNFSSHHSVKFAIYLFSFQKLNIKYMVFKTAQINGTELLGIQTDQEFFLMGFYLYDLNIFAQDQQRLILMQNRWSNNQIQQIYIKSINVTAQEKSYVIVQFLNQGQMSHVRIIYIKIINIRNEPPINSIYLFYTDLFQIEIYSCNVQQTYSINFVYSSSRVLVMQFFKFVNIFRKFIDYQSLIKHRSSSTLYLSETIQIKNLYAKQFQGIFLATMSYNQMDVILQDLSFNMPISIYQLFQLIQSTERHAKLYILRLQLANQQNNQLMQSQNSYIETNFDVVIINELFIQNITKQLLNIIRGKEVSIIDIFVNKYNSHEEIFVFNCEQINLILTLSNLIIKNSFIQKGFVLDLFLFKQIIKIDNIKFINITVADGVFKLQSSFNQSNIKLHNIIFQGVKSNQFLFKTTLSINIYTTTIIGGTYEQIFSDGINKIEFINGLITNIKQQCLLSKNNTIYLNSSEIVDSNIMQHNDELIIYKSQYKGTFTNLEQNAIIFLSLNNGKSLFTSQQIYKNLYQFQLSKNDNFLYLPSGRDIQDYRYFNFATRQYSKLYDSISYVSYFQDKTNQCVLKQNFNHQPIYLQEVIIQTGVNIIQNLTFTLNPYLKDKYIELDLICNQNEVQITYRTLIKTFNCQLGEHLIKDQCKLCDIEQHLYSVGYNQQYCLYMDQNSIQQLNIGQIKLYEQFWRHSYANKYIEQCKNFNCLGGWLTGDDSCKIGYIGALCSECDVFNSRGLGSFGKIDNQCSLCYFDYSIYIKGLLIIIIQLILIYISYYSNKQQSEQYLFLRISKRKFTEILQRQNINQVTILLKLYYNYLFTFYLLKDIINFGKLFDLTLNMVYNPGFIAIPQFECLIKKMFQFPIQYNQLILKICIPMCLLNLIVIIYTFLIKFKLAKYSIYVIIVCLLIINQQNQQIIIQSLIKLSLPIKYSNVYWTLENLSIQYYSRSHQHYLLLLILPSIILITFFNVLVFFWIRFINKRIYNHQKLSLFIYKQYKSLFYYWEYLRLLFIYLFMVILYSQDKSQIILLSIVFVTLTYLCKPFEHQNINRIDQLILIFSLYTYYSILMYQNEDTSFKFIIIIFSNLILLKIYLKSLMHSFNIQYKDQKIILLNQIIKQIPFLRQYVNTQIYEKNKYFIQVLKQSRKKSNPSLTPIIQNAESRSNPYLSFEVEMTMKQLK